MKKQHIQYTVERKDKLNTSIPYPTETQYIAVLTYFTGEDIVRTTEKFESEEQAWKWITEQLKSNN